MTLSRTMYFRIGFARADGERLRELATLTGIPSSDLIRKLVSAGLLQLNQPPLIPVVPRGRPAKESHV